MQENRFQYWKDDLLNTDQKLLVIEIGAGTAIPSVRYASESMNTDIIRINPRESHGPDNVVSIALAGLEALQAIENHVDL